MAVVLILQKYLQTGYRALIWLIYPTGNFIGSWFALWEN